MVCCARFLLRHWSESKNRFSTMGLQNSSTVGIAHSKIREHKVIEHWTAQYKNTLRRICPKKSFELKWTRVFWLGGKTGHLHTHLGKFWWLKIRHSSPQDVFFSFPQQNTWPVVVSNEKVAKTLNLMKDPFSDPSLIYHQNCSPPPPSHFQFSNFDRECEEEP